VIGSPNLLNLLIETENSEEPDESSDTIVAINLRLSEIEFADVKVRAGRNQIEPGNAAEIAGAGVLKQQERAVEAEAAWRASWFEE